VDSLNVSFSTTPIEHAYTQHKLYTLGHALGSAAQPIYVIITELVSLVDISILIGEINVPGWVITLQLVARRWNILRH